MKVEDVVKAYADELENWDFFSDSQRAYVEDGYIVVCLRNYNWFKTRNKITNSMEAMKALFEIDWIAEYVEDENYEEECWKRKLYTESSKFWKLI